MLHRFVNQRSATQAVQHWFGLAATDPKARAPSAFACLWRRWRGEIENAPVGLHVFAIAVTRPNAS